MDIHVFIRKEDLEPDVVADKVVVVLDVIFATSTIVAAFTGGATGVRPASGRDEAESFVDGRPREAVVLTGEFNSVTFPGFVDPTPLALLAHPVAGREVIFASTNGTVALRRASGAKAVYAASLSNVGAIAEHLIAAHRTDSIILACAGSMGRLSFEDFFGAGAIASRLRDRLGEALTLTDAALAACSAYRGTDALTCLRTSNLGRDMITRGLGKEVDFAAAEENSRCVPSLQDGVLRNAP